VLYRVRCGCGKTATVQTEGAAFMLRNWWVGQGCEDSKVFGVPGDPAPDIVWRRAHTFVIGDLIDDPPPPGFYDRLTAAELVAECQRRDVPYCDGPQGRVRKAEMIRRLLLRDDRTVHDGALLRAA